MVMDGHESESEAAWESWLVMDGRACGWEMEAAWKWMGYFRWTRRQRRLTPPLLGNKCERNG